MINCTACEWCLESSDHDSNGYIQNHYRCTNYKFETIIGTDKSCATMRATSCGPDASGFMPIDWERRDTERDDRRKQALWIVFGSIALGSIIAIIIKILN